MNCFTGIDIGTYSSKGVIVDANGKVLAFAQRQHGIDTPRHGWAEHDPDSVWWDDFCVLSRELIRSAQIRASEIATVGVSAIAPCVVPVSEDGSPLRPAILYGIDTRAVEEIEELNRSMGTERIQRVSGTALSAQSAGPKILWIKNHEESIWRKTDKFLTATSFIVQRLTGRAVIDNYTAAFFDPLFSIRTRSWDPEAARFICGLSQLPESHWANEIAGTVIDAVAERTGFEPGTPVIVGTADAASEAISAGVSQVGDAMLMYGSSLFIITLTSDISPNDVFWPAPFLYPGSTALAAGMATTGSITEWFRRNLSMEADFTTLAAEAATVIPGSEGLLMLPYFSGERTPINDPAARGVVAGLSLRHTRAHIYRAIMEGVAYGIRHNLERMSGTTAVPTRIFSVGGGTKNHEWLQIVSDVTGRAQVVCDTPGACFGNAILAANGSGLFRDRGKLFSWLPRGTRLEPNRENAAVYNEYYRLYLKLYKDTVETVHVLSGLAAAHETGAADEL